MRRITLGLRLPVLLAPVVLAQVAAAQTAPRSETPIYEIDHYQASSSGGAPTFSARYYGLNVTIARRQVAVGLDTGSIGLRLLPRAIPPGAAQDDGATAHYGYASGTVIVGPPAEADVTIGGLRAPINVQRVEQVICAAGRPTCPAANLSRDEFGFFGGGQPYAGFAGIMGIRLGSVLTVANPLIALGAHRWIVRLPQPYAQNTGKLVINPTDQEVADFVPLSALPEKTPTAGEVQGCITPAPGATPLCGSVLLDTGTPGLSVSSAQTLTADAGAQATLQLLTQPGNAAVSISFPQGQPANIAFNKGTATGIGGALPFWGVDVLFDGDTGQISVRPRRPAVIEPLTVQ